MARWLSSPIYTSGPEMPVDVRDGVSIVLPEDGTWTNLEPAYQTVMLEGEDAFLWIETVWVNVSLTRLSPSLMNLEFRGTVEARGWVYLSQDRENAMVINLALGNTPDELFRKAEAEVVWVACQWREMEMERVDVRVELGDRGSMRRPVRTMRCVLPPFLVDAVFGTRSRLVWICQSMTNLGLYQCGRQNFFRLSVEMRPFEGNWAEELTEMLNCLSVDNVFVPSSVHWGIVYRNVAVGEIFLEGVKELFYSEEGDFSDEDEDELGKMTTEDETDNRRSEGGPGLGGSAVQSEEGQKDRESINPDGTKGNWKEISSGESSGKAGGSRQGTQETKEGRNKDRTTPQNSEGVVSKKVRVKDARCKLEEIEKRTAEYKARLIEEMMTGNEEGRLQEEPRDERKTGRGGIGQAQVSRPALPSQEAVVPPGVANRGFGRRDAANEQCKYCTAVGHFVRACPKLNHDMLKRRCTRSLKGEVFGPQGERVNWNLAGGMRQAIIMLNGLAIAAIEVESVVDIIWDQLRGRAPQVNFIQENDGRDRVNAATRLRTAGRRIIRDTVMEEVARSFIPLTEPEVGEPEKVYGKPREEEPTDKVTAAKKKFMYQIPILTMPEIDDTLSKLLGTMMSMSFHTMLQASPRLLKGLKQLLTRRRVEIDENPESPEEEREEEAPQEVANLQRSCGDLKDLEKVFADIRLGLPDREGGEVMRAPPGTKLNFHALPVGKLKIQIGTHYTDVLVDGGAEITLIRRDFATITGCTVNKEVTGSIRGAGGEIPFAGYVTKCAVKAGIRESIWSFQRMTVMEGMNHNIILGRSWCTNVEMIGMHLYNGTYMVDIEDPVTGRGELLRLLGTGGDPLKRKLTTWSPSFEDSARKGAFARMEGMRERVEIMIEKAFHKKEWIKMGLPQKKRRQEDEVLGVMVAERESEVELGASLPKRGKLDATLIPLVRIHTVEHECWNDKGPFYEFGIAGEVTDLLRAKVESFVAEPTASPYANRWFVFRKPNKMLRWIQDLQRLNAVTIQDAGSLPQANLLAESHAGRSIYSLIDLYSGYDQLPLDVRDRPYTAMHTPVGQLQMQVTPMGFTNEVVEVHRRMLAVARDMFPEKCEPYIDDNPIKGAQEKNETKVQPGIRRFVWDHLQDIKDLLRRFLVYNITASGPKSILAVPKVTILGFRCGAYCRKPNPAKTDQISQWPSPCARQQSFAKIVEPIQAMIRKEGTMDWTEEREGAVQTLKDILTSEQVALSAPCFNDEVGRPFILEMDGGPFAVGGVLIQRDEEGKNRPIRFESRTPNSAKRRYSQFKKEVLAILHCLKTFQAYLFGRRFILRIDPTNVVGALKNYRPIDPTVGRWVGFIWQFDYKIERIVGIRNKANGLSRVCITSEGVEDAEPIDAFLKYEGGTLAVDNETMGEKCASGELLIRTLEKGAPAVVAELREGPVTTRGRKEEKDSWGAIVGLKEELIAMAVEGGHKAVMSLLESWERKELRWMVNQVQERKDEDQKGKEFFYAQIYEVIFRDVGLLLVGNKQPMEVSIKAREVAERYVLRGGHLFQREEGAMPRRVVCGRRKQLDVIQAMHDGLAGGHRSSKGTLAKITPLYYWPGMVATYCQTCLICQERSSARIFEPLRPTRVVGPGHLVHLDLAVMPVSTDGYRYILDARDNLSGFVEAVALKKKTGRSVADWIEDFYLRHSFVKRFIADNGIEFVNQEVLGMLNRLHVLIKLIEPYHPEANAPVERGHRIKEHDCEARSRLSGELA
ncbi:hypothetical protein CBR_g55341 [Chara braunii]|uniref:Integrase catalytic domain-containing protein n=1 Tax=Chara braunii TaxID=69332 RepID=A0A388MCW4_CHABU|nr:hypothetical protein CBR_g55341 [Chara braunii]|eukprot:GBG92406.1 hypothetical protein CBR_g55341 [Chara braunii]